MDLYEVSKSGKSITKFTLQANEKMKDYKENQASRIDLYQFETTDFALLDKVLNRYEMSHFEIDSGSRIDAHKKLGQFSMEEDASYSELKRFSTLYYYSLHERISLEKAWAEYVSGNYECSRLLNVYLGTEESKGAYCNHLLLSENYEEIHPFDSPGGGVHFT